MPINCFMAGDGFRRPFNQPYNVLSATPNLSAIATQGNPGVSFKR